MKVVHKNQTNEFKNSETCFGLQYEIGDKDIDGAIVNVCGRYPEKGNITNLVCKEIAYVVSGSGKLGKDGKEYILNEGDIIFLDEGEKFFWEGNMTMFTACSPAWYAEQHKIVE